MSDSEHEYDSYMEEGSDCDSSGDDNSECSSNHTGASEETFSSFQYALEEMMAGLAQLDEGLNAVADTTHTLEQPIATVAIQSFTNPRVLEAAPFRATKFRLRSDAKRFLGTPHHTVTFAELCAAIRLVLRNRKEEAERMWGTSDFLDILQKLPNIVE